MREISLIFDHQIDIDPAANLDDLLKQIPAKWVVYLLTDEADQPIQLLCVKNLRASLKRRLGGEEMIGRSRRANYRDIVRRIYWRRVDSAFEADWIYYEAASQIFPRTYQGMVGFRPAWFVHIDSNANFPRYIKTSDLTIKTGVYIGPFEDKHAAARFIQLAEDSFDLCRYYNILVDAPRGKACAYKDMGKCPAPCDGSISMDQYRRMIDWSAQVGIHPAEMIEDQTRRMQQAAEELRFETAGKIKAYIDQISQFGQGPFRFAQNLENFQFLSLQPGPREGSAKLFLITPGRIEDIAGLITAPDNPAEILQEVHALIAGRSPSSADRIGAERIGIAAHHLFSPKQTSGSFLPLKSLDEKFLIRSYRNIQNQKPQGDIEDEGMMKELQAMG